ncbi:MAG: serine hydrolase domain-containing protein [Promethearchaeota archaeon]|jgi:CubicO group peptidase (beta-lactamase class C family)
MFLVRHKNVFNRFFFFLDGDIIDKNIEIKGYCKEGFESVKEVFAENFTSGLDVGASLALTINGKFVIDIWAGYRDEAQTQPWERNTIVNVYSTTKVMTALCVLMLVDRGKIDLDAPVSEYWPEFAQAGKEKLPVRYLLSHTAGLPGFDAPIEPETLYNWDKCCEILASQKPWWEPGTKSGYHSITFGYLLGQLVRRVTGKTLGTFFKEEVAESLNADFHIGLPEELDSRVGELIPPVPEDPQDQEESDPNSIPYRVFTNPILTGRETLTREWRAAEIPASNGHGNARSVARVGAALACGGSLDGIRLLSLKTIEKVIEEQSYNKDLCLSLPIRFGLGFGLVSKDIPISPNPRAFYWGGWGGSHVTMDLDAKLCWAYAMNRMMMSLTGGVRTQNIRDAIYEAL